MKRSARGPVATGSFFVVVVLTLTGCIRAKVPAASRASEEQGGSGGLIVLIVVDQMRPDYLDRFAPLMVPRSTGALQSASDQSGQHRGLQWFRHGGAWFTSARTAAAPTVTAAGHASLCSGNAPVVHGIASNELFDRQQGRVVGVAADAGATTFRTPGLLGQGALENAPEDGSSGKRLKVGTLSSQLKKVFPDSRSIAVSVKDRSALICGGPDAWGAYFFDKRSGSFVTSSWAGAAQLPEWVHQFNRAHRPEKRGPWALKLNDRAKYQKIIGEANLTATAKALEGKTLAFPFGVFPRSITAGKDSQTSRLADYERFVLTPAASDLVARFALEAVVREKLGQRNTLDSLVVSFSTPDLVGHQYGSSSLEFVDTYLHLNSTIELLREGIEQTVGTKTPIVWALAADHGIAPIPELSQATPDQPQRIDGRQFRKQLDERLSASPFFAGHGLRGSELITSMVLENIYLDHSLLAAKGLDPEQVAKNVALAVAADPMVVASFTQGELALAAADAKKTAFSHSILDELRDAAKKDPSRVKDYAKAFYARGYQPDQMGDVVFVLKEGSLLSFGPPLANHGSVWDDDARITMAVVAPATRAGTRVDKNVYADDLVPTLLDLASVSLDRVGPFTGVSRAADVVAR
jgi:hypothetical protein